MKTLKILYHSEILALSLYNILNFIDLFLTLAVLRLNVPEGNPILAWFHSHGLLVHAKVGLVLIGNIIIIILWKKSPEHAPIFSWIVNASMTAVFIYHIIGLNLLHKIA